MKKETKKPQWKDSPSSSAKWLVQDTWGEWHFFYAKPDEVMDSYKYSINDGVVSKEKTVTRFDLSTLEERP